MTFDKTGTLTYGTPKVIAAEPISSPDAHELVSAEEVYRLCAAAEQLSEHPLGKAVVSSYRAHCGDVLPACKDFQLIPGCGVSADVDGKAVLAGNREMMQENGISLGAEALSRAEQYLQRGCTVIYVAADDRAVGLLVLSDTIREESPDMIDSLNELSVQPVLLTGDNENAARAIAGEVHISEVRANCRPEDRRA